MRYWKAGIMFLVGLIIQTSLLNLISIKGYTPNILLCLVALFSFLYDDEIYGIVYGAVFGVLYDICFSNVIGPTPIALVIVGITIIFVREYANKENIVNMWFVSLLSIVEYYGLNWVLLKIAGNPIGLIYVLKTLPWIMAYSLILITILYLILLKTVIKYRKDRYFR